MKRYPTISPSASFVHFARSTCRIGRIFLLLSIVTCGHLMAQEVAASENAQAPKDPFDREAQFVEYLLRENLFDYANLAIEEARVTFPELTDRIQVVEVSVLLRQGKTAEVEQILSGRNLATDMSAQAMLLQLAMTHDAMGNNAEAMTRYQQFLDLNQGKEITDPDVLRYFASGALRLSMILQADQKFDEADKVLQLVIKTTDDSFLKRKFTQMAAQNALDQALTQSGNARTASLNKAKKLAEDLIWGATDNYFYMGMGIRSWVIHLQGNTEEAVKALADIRGQVRELEETMDEQDLPKSEYPRAVIRLVEGRIQWDLAKKALEEGGEDTAKRQAARAAGNFYNSFLNYEGSEYANRAALLFEDLKVWVKESFGTELRMGDASPRLAELMFKRQLDLARNLFQNGQLETAKSRLLEAFGTYPDTQYTLIALDTLSRIWIEKEREWELMALAGHISDQFPDQEAAARIMLRVGRKMADDENLFGVEQVLGAFGRNYPSHPNAPGMLYRIGKAAEERGERGLAHDVYQDVLRLYPNSNFAVSVLQARGDEALAAENFEEAVKAYEQVRDQARNPLQAAFARLRITDIKLTSGEVELEEEALGELRVLREELSQTDSSFYAAGNREQSLRFLQNVRYRIGQVLLRKAGREGDAELRAQAANELNSFLQDYPDTDQAPDVMYNLGRLYLQQGQFDQATRTFDRLASRYPTSAAGRDALYSLVRAALEENQVEVAQDAVRRMVEQPESYEIEKIYQVAQLMLDNERWQEAKSSFDLVLASDRIRDDDTLRQRMLYGLGKSSIGSEEYEAAVESLQTLISDYPRSALVVDAGISLSEANLRMDPPRTEQAREALGAVSRILASRPDKTDRARRDIASGHVAMAEGESGTALASWYEVGLTQPDSEELGALVREAIQLALEVAQEQVREGNLRRWNLIVELTDQYLRNFPLDRKADEMRSLNVRAISMAPEE